MPSGNNLGSWDGVLRDMRQKRKTALMTAMYKYSGRLTMR